MSTPKQLHGVPFQGTTTHATAAVATITAVTGKAHFITDIAASSDKAGAIVVVKQGTTVIWQIQLAANDRLDHSFVTPLEGAIGALVSIEVDGTSACKVNIAGFTL